MNEKINFNDKLKSTNIIVALGFFLLAIFIDLFLEEFGLNSDIGTDLAYVIFIVLMLIWLRNTSGMKEKFLETFDFKIWKDVIYVFLLTTFIEYLFNIFLSERIFFETSYNVSLYDPLSLCIISTVIFTPIAEELFFRGILFNRLNLFFSKQKRGLFMSIFITTFLFAMAHGIEDGFIIFLTSFPFCTLYLKYDNIFVSMLLHAITNLSVMFSLVLYSYDIINIDGIICDSTSLSLIFSLLGIISIFLMIRYLIKDYKLIKRNM